MRVSTKDLAQAVAVGVGATLMMDTVAEVLRRTRITRDPRVVYARIVEREASGFTP